MADFSVRSPRGANNSDSAWGPKCESKRLVASDHHSGRGYLERDPGCGRSGRVLNDRRNIVRSMAVRAQLGAIGRGREMVIMQKIVFHCPLCPLSRHIGCLCLQS